MGSYTNTGLPYDWAYSPSIDLELKQYTLLGYLQQVKARFAEQKLYPHLELVKANVDELLRLQRCKLEWANNLTGALLGFDPGTGSAIHERPEEAELMKVIDEVIDFAVPGLMRAQSEGMKLREEFVGHITCVPVGLQPLYLSEGWLLLRSGEHARVYSYSIPFLRERKADLRHHNLVTRYVTTLSLSLTRSYEHIKAELIRQHPSLPNPATFAVECDVELPHIETFVPLAKWVAFTHLSAPVQ